VLLAASTGKLNWKVIREVGIETTLTTCFIFAIFIGATVFAYVLRLIGGDELIAEFFKGLGLGPGWCWWCWRWCSWPASSWTGSRSCSSSCRCWHR
jgi:hypothetical protein